MSKSKKNKIIIHITLIIMLIVYMVILYFIVKKYDVKFEYKKDQQSQMKQDQGEQQAEDENFNFKDVEKVQKMIDENTLFKKQGKKKSSNKKDEEEKSGDEEKQAVEKVIKEIEEAYGKKGADKAREIINKNKDKITKSIKEGNYREINDIISPEVTEDIEGEKINERRYYDEQEIKSTNVNQFRAETLCRMFKCNLDLQYFIKEREKLKKEFTDPEDIFYLGIRSCDAICHYYYSKIDFLNDVNKYTITEAVTYLEKGIKLANKKYEVETEYYYDMFLFYFYLQEFNKSEYYTIKGLQYAKNTNNELEMIIANIAKLNCYLAMGKSTESVKLAEKIVLDEKNCKQYIKQRQELLKDAGLSLVDGVGSLPGTSPEYLLCCAIFLKEYYPDLSIKYFRNYMGRSNNGSLRNKASGYIKTLER